MKRTMQKGNVTKALQTSEEVGANTRICPNKAAGGVLLVVILVALLAAGVVRVQAGNGFDLFWWTITSGGTSSGAAYTLNAAVGQAVTGAGTRGGIYELCSGYLCNPALYEIYFPMLRR